MGILAVYDIVGIQSYIFSSNKLAENVGASKLVADVLGTSKGSLAQVMRDVTGQDPLKWMEYAEMPGLDADLKAEILYQGGGSAFAAFADEGIFQKVTEQFLIQVHQKSPGLGVAVAAVETEFKEGYQKDLKNLRSRLEHVKRGFNIPAFAGNQPITRQSERTALPVTCFGNVFEKEDKEYMSQDQLAKRKRYKKYIVDKFDDKGRVEEFIKSNDVITNFNELAVKKGEDSLIAIIHVDGNNMGSRVRAHMHELKSDCYAEAVPRMRKMSRAIDECYREARKITIDAFKNEYKKYIGDDSNPVPLLELIGDGDDTTIVMPGRFAIDFAARLLREIEKIEKRPFEDNVGLTACAGVVIFHNHYPFSEAYKLAEALCANAKKPSRTEEGEGSYIDFHLHSSAGVARLDQLREQQYKVEGKTILRRPWRVSEGHEDKYPSFKWFEQGIQTIKTAANLPRNKTKALKNAIAAGERAAKLAENQLRAKDKLPKKIKVEKDNPRVISKYASLFDILELCDTYENLLKMEGKENDKNENN